MQLYSMATPNVVKAIILLDELLALGIYHGCLPSYWAVPRTTPFKPFSRIALDLWDICGSCPNLPVDHRSENHML